MHESNSSYFFCVSVSHTLILKRASFYSPNWHHGTAGDSLNVVHFKKSILNLSYNNSNFDHKALRCTEMIL